MKGQYIMEENKPGRPPMFSEPMKLTALHLPGHMLDFIKRLIEEKKTPSFSEYVRNLIDQDMNNRGEA